jgi:hypothetical protein
VGVNHWSAIDTKGMENAFSAGAHDRVADVGASGRDEGSRGCRLLSDATAEPPILPDLWTLPAEVDPSAKADAA